MIKGQGKRSKQAGFSLIELMVVVTVIGILASMAGPILTKYRDRAKIAAAKNAGRNVLSALVADAATRSDSGVVVPDTCDDLARVSTRNGFFFSKDLKASLCPAGDPIDSGPPVGHGPYSLCLCFDHDIDQYTNFICGSAQFPPGCLTKSPDPPIHDFVLVCPILDVQADAFLVVSTVTGVGVVTTAELPVSGPVEPTV